ncbi:LysR substrate-binding domain-containing protein [Aestuariivirga sp.]|uniref:LysR substrate-binding domain-containing protein n=1 Tax=Aestuariivirga sp. TaxID=2650926 RepID=UPI003593B616
MKESLPPLSALIAFEAAGRLQSFTRAAEELNVTQAAVSRQIRLLEDHLRKPLFTRAHRSVELTNEGRSYLHTVFNALKHVSAATRELKSAGPTSRLSVAVDQSIAHLWLPQHLNSLREVFPDAGLRLIVSDDDKLCLGNDIDVALIHGGGIWPGHEGRLLFPEEVFPVCSPACLASRPSLKLVDLRGESLLDLDDDHWNWLNWRQWLTGKGIGMAAAPRSLTMTSYPLVIEAARRGLGFALGWRGLVDDDLREGRLVAPFPDSLRSSLGYHLVWPRDRPQSAAALRFIEWAFERNG